MCIVLQSRPCAIDVQLCEVAIAIQDTSIKSSWGVISGPILSLTTDIVYISVFPGFWKWIPMIHMQELLMTASTVSLCPCRYSLHTQVMILMRSCGLVGPAITSVEGCCLYIIIHNSILHGTWL